jgi:predicted nucleic acid-binding protein
MIILDTNVLSSMMRERPDETVISWLDRQPRTSVWITSVTVLEVLFGLQILATGRRRALLMQAFQQLLERISSRVAPFDVVAAEHSADLMASRQKKGRPVDLRDTMIAGIALAHNATIATRNTSHFADAGLMLINPWKAS